MRLLPLLLIAALSSCTNKPKDTDIVLVTSSVLGATVHIATFNGNSASKSADCVEVAKLLTTQTHRVYECPEYSSVKKAIDKEPGF